jgi:ribonuclease HI
MGALMAASGMSPAETLVEKRMWRFWAQLQGAPLTQDGHNYPKPWEEMRRQTGRSFGELPSEQTRADFQQTETRGHIVIEDAGKAIHEAEHYAQLECSTTYFTDGSRLDNGRSGAACIRVINRQSEQFERILRPMGLGKEAFDTELEAILLALRNADDRREKGFLMGDIHIFTDSMSALQRIRKTGYGSGQSQVHGIHNWETKIIALADCTQIIYHWVPGHHGVWGNEQADKAAKAAAAAPESQVQPHHRYRSLAHTARIISKRATNSRKSFISSRKGKKFGWNGRLQMNPALRNESKRDASIFWQMQSGHALTGDYLKNKIRKDNDGTCWHCGSGQQMTRSHLIERCAAFTEERRELRNDMRRALKKEAAKRRRHRWSGRAPVRHMFSKECLTRAVMDFLKATKIGRTGRPPDDEGQIG